MESVSLTKLVQAIQASWPVDATNKTWGEWSPENPSRGQCVPSSLVVQDYFGGDIVRYRITNDQINETHYFNVLDDGTILDTTGSQYKEAVTMNPEPVDLAKNNFSTMRERLLASDETSERYNILKSRVESQLAQS